MRRKSALVQSVSVWPKSSVMQKTEAKIYLDASLTPNRSLSPKAFAIVMAIVGSVSFLAGMMFVSIGAFPVIGFFGLDALAIYMAFRWSHRNLRQETRIRVTADAVDLTHRQGRKPVKNVSLPTAFARVKLALPERRPSELQLSYRNETWVIGRFLTPAERKSLKAAIETALHRARNERFESA